MRAWATTVVGLACLLLAACGGQVIADESARAGSGGTPAATDAGGTGAGGAKPGLVAPEHGILVVDENDVPIPGAIVVVDRAGGIEEQRITHPQGVAFFSDVDFASETVDVTAFSPGRILVTVLGVAPTSSRVLHLRPRRSSAEWTRTLMLKFRNQVSSNDCVAAGLTASSVHDATCDVFPQPDSMTLKTTPGASGKVIALDLAHGTGPDWPPSSMVAAFVGDIPSKGDTVDVDFAKSLPIEIASGTLAVPDPGCGAGITTRRVEAESDVEAFFPYDSFFENGACHWKTAYVRAFPESEVETVYYSCMYGITFFGVFQHGYFPSTPPPPLPDPIFFTSVEASLFDPIEWTAGSELPDRLLIWAGDEHDVFPEFRAWTVWFPPGTDRVSLRKPPETIWKQLDWRNGQSVSMGLEYCDPGPGECGGRPCTPTEQPWCKRYVHAFSPNFPAP